MKKIHFILSGVTTILPSMVYAATASSKPQNFGQFVSLLTGYASQLIGLLVIVALAVFFYRIVISIYKVGSDVKAVEQGKTLLLWGIIALFVMVSVWGIVNFLGNATGVGSGSNPVIPQLEGHTK